MYERMLNKQLIPTVEEMTTYCSEKAELFSMINDWLTTTFHTVQKVVFPYGNKLPWSKCCATVIDKYGVCWWIVFLLLVRGAR